jgi:GTP pyrophosphokinase
MKFVRTSKARSKIKRWIKESMLEQSQKLGAEIIQQQFKRFNIKKEAIDLNEIAQTFGLSDESQLYSAIGRGDVSAKQVIDKSAPEKHEAGKKEENILKRFLSKAQGSAKGVRVQGMDNLLIAFGRCCQPVPGDRILGFITQGIGVVIHRSDCRNILKLMENPERNIEVEWNVERDGHFMVRLHMLGEDRKNFLRDVSESISQTDTNIVSVEMRAEDSFVHSNIIIEVRNLQHLTRVINKISKVNGVISVERLDETGELVSEK